MPINERRVIKNMHGLETYKVERPHQMDDGEGTWTAAIRIVDHWGDEVLINMYGPTQESVTPQAVGPYEVDSVL